MPRQTEHLWHFAISHFTEKARWALDYKQVPHTRELLFLDYPIRAFLKTGQLSLPILFTNRKPIVDSTDIIAHLETRYPSMPLHPIAFPPEYPYEIPGVSLEALHALRAPIQQRPARAWVERMYRLHRGEYDSSARSEA